jgi:hypothetical protein
MTHYLKAAALAAVVSTAISAIGMALMLVLAHLGVF